MAKQPAAEKGAKGKGSGSGARKGAQNVPADVIKAVTKSAGTSSKRKQAAAADSDEEEGGKKRKPTVSCA